MNNAAFPKKYFRMTARTEGIKSEKYNTKCSNLFCYFDEAGYSFQQFYFHCLSPLKTKKKNDQPVTHCAK